MSRTGYQLVLATLVGIALLGPGISSADVQVGIGFGTTIGPHHPHYGYYSGWPMWPTYSWYDPWYDPWWYYPGLVVVGPPVIVEPPVVRERIIVREHKPPAPPKEQTPDLVAEKLQQKKSEQLKKLKIGDPSNRVQANKDDSDRDVRQAAYKAIIMMEGY